MGNNSTHSSFLLAAPELWRPVGSGLTGRKLFVSVFFSASLLLSPATAQDLNVDHRSREMSGQHSEQGMFHDASSYFSVEDWKLLHEWQKDLYRNVMKEIHQALISLGPLIATTVFSLKAKGRAEQCPSDDQDSERKHSVNASPSDEMVDSDVLFRLNSEEHRHLKNPGVSEGRKVNDCLSAGGGEPVSMFIDHLGTEVGESSNDCNPGHAITTSVVSFRIKDEEEVYSMDHQDSERIEGIRSPSDYGSMNREWKDEHFGKSSKETLPCKAQLGKDKVKLLQSPGKEIHSSNQLWSGSYQELEEEKTTQCEIPFSNPLNSILHQESSKVEISNSYNECESNLGHDNLLTYKPNMQKRTRYLCTECMKSFSAKTSVVRHQRTHRGERPFQCNECEKSFIQSGDLIRHRRSHSGERPYHCTECGKSFSQKGDLRRHQRMHDMYAKQMHNPETLS